MLDVKALSEQVVVVVRDYVARATASINTRIDALAEQIKAIPAGKDGEPGGNGRDGNDGKDGAPGRDGKDGIDGKAAEVDYERVMGIVRSAVDLIPAPANGKDGKDGADGINGKDADPEFIRALIAEGFSALPAPKDGLPGRDGADGKSVTVEDVAPLIAAQVSKAVEALPTPPAGAPGRDGADGADGKDGESPSLDLVLEALAPSIAKAAQDAAATAIAAIPQPKDGAPGRDGADGKSVEISEIDALITERVQKAVSALPEPKAGEPGRDGRDGKDAKAIDFGAVLDALKPSAESAAREVAIKAIADIPAPKNGEPGKDGVDGKSLTIDDVRQLLEAESARHALDFERRANELAQRTIDDMRQRMERAIEAMPKPRDGRDAMSLDDLEITQGEDGRTVTLSFRCGDQVKERTLKFACVLDQGIFRAGGRYSQGDGVTWRGSFFIAKKDAPTGEPGDSDDWRLAVKRGRDGKDAAPIVERQAGPVRLR